ncbi:MAG: hypothetical protein KF831_06765 [Acidobacteria bacterium]|nr:hypothetical protein [Acidobacteriota bacterium]
MAKAQTKKGKVVSMNDVAKVSELKEWGFRVTDNEGNWSATRGSEGEDEYEFYGPCDSVSALHTKVKLEARPPQFAEEKAEASDEDDRPPGDDFLFDEMRPKPQEHVKELEIVIKNYDELKLKRVEMLEREKEAKKISDAALRRHEDKLAHDPETGIKSYRTKDGIIAELVPGDYSFRTRHEEEDEG